MRYIQIEYDKTAVRVVRLPKGTIVSDNQRNCEEVLCAGSSFGDVVKALEQAFGEEMKA